MEEGMGHCALDFMQPAGLEGPELGVVDGLA